MNPEQVVTQEGVRRTVSRTPAATNSEQGHLGVRHRSRGESSRCGRRTEQRVASKGGPPERAPLLMLWFVLR